MSVALVLAAALAAQPDPKSKQPEPLFKLPPFAEAAMKADDRDPPLRKIQKERARERAEYLRQTDQVIQIGNWDRNALDAFLRTQAAFGENLAELVADPADRVKCYELRVEAAKRFESFIAARVRAGSGPPQELNLAKAARLDAEVELLRVKEAATPAAAAPQPVAAWDCARPAAPRASRGLFPLRQR